MGKFQKYFPYLGFTIFLLVATLASVLLATQKNISFGSKAAEKKAEIWLLPPKIEIDQNQTAEIKVFLNTNQQEINGVNLVLKYNPQSIEIEENIIKPGPLFNYYRNRLIDDQKGIIRLSSSGKFKGQGTFATFKIKGKAPGESKVTVITPQESLDSTVVWDNQRKENLLGNTQSVNIVVH